MQRPSTVGQKNPLSHSRSTVGVVVHRPAVRCEASSDGEKPERMKGIFEFVTDNPSSRNAIQLEATPAQDGNLGQMITVSGHGREETELLMCERNLPSKAEVENLRTTNAELAYHQHIACAAAESMRALASLRV